MRTWPCSRCPAEVPGREVRARFEGERLLYLCGPCEAKWAAKARTHRGRFPIGLTALLFLCMASAGLAFCTG